MIDKWKDMLPAPDPDSLLSRRFLRPHLPFLWPSNHLLLNTLGRKFVAALGVGCGDGLLSLRLAIGAPEPEAGVADHEGQDGKVDHHSLKKDECVLVGDLGRVAVALAQLVDAVGATGQDEEVGRREAGEEELLAAGHDGGGALGPLQAHVAHHVIYQEAEEDAEHDDLQDETAHGDVVSDGG